MTRDRAARRALGLLAIVAACLVPACVQVPDAAAERDSAQLKATLTPERLGASTTVGIGFKILSPPHEAPPPLTEIQVRYPTDLGFSLSELGLATCSRLTLEAAGPQGCPANSLMGYGSTLVDIPLGSEIVHETARVTIVKTTEQDGHLALLLYADGETPVIAQITLSGLILPAAPPFGGRLDMSFPLIPGFPGAPDVAIVQFEATLGPRHLAYHERVNGQVVSYEPRGIPLPRSCPRGGFPFSAKFGFLDGSHAYARTAVPCPRRASPDG